jgi:hypothetical protein
MFKAVTGKELVTTAFGKPQIGTFEFATRLLKQWRKATHGINAPPETVYFVGDTPESDIRGTNEYNKHAQNTWYSILVSTGVYQPGTEPKYTPNHIVDTVLDAVNHGIERETRRQLRESLDISGKGKLEGTAIADTAPPTPAVGSPTIIKENPMEKLAFSKSHATAQKVN